MNTAVVAMTKRKEKKEGQPLEAEIKKNIMAYLKDKGHFEVIHRTSYGNAGISDILGCMQGGRFVAIEVKREGTNPNSNQQAFIDAINDAGGVAFVARSVDDVIFEFTNAKLWG